MSALSMMKPRIPAVYALPRKRCSNGIGGGILMLFSIAHL